MLKIGLAGARVGYSCWIGSDGIVSGAFSTHPSSCFNCSSGIPKPGSQMSYIQKGA